MEEVPRPIKELKFGLMSPDEIRNYSVMKVTNADPQATGEGDDGGGLFDPRLGAVNKNEQCSTCYHGPDNCPCHLGYIELAIPLFKQEYTKLLKLIMECTCIRCHEMLFQKKDLKRKVGNLKNKQAQDAVKKMLPSNTKKIRKCLYCGTIQPKYSSPSTLMIMYTYSHLHKDEEINQEFMPDNLPENVFKEMVRYDTREIYHRLTMHSNETISWFGIDYQHARPEWMMWTILPVAPPAVRPSSHSDGQHSHDDLTHLYIKIIRENKNLNDRIQKGKEYSLIIDELNTQVAAIVFNTVKPVTHKQTHKPLLSIKKRLDGKEALFRRHLQAKRVNAGARSVVGAGAHIPIHHLGVPIQICMKLSIPKIVTPWNKEELQQAVYNGPKVYPGANYIKSGPHTRSLEVVNRHDIVLQIGDEVGQHLIAGDTVLFNRQPTLWRPNFMAHKVVPVPHKTFRLNLSATGPYNADQLKVCNRRPEKGVIS